MVISHAMIGCGDGIESVKQAAWALSYPVTLITAQILDHRERFGAWSRRRPNVAGAAREMFHASLLACPLHGIRTKVSETTIRRRRIAQRARMREFEDRTSLSEIEQHEAERTPTPACRKARREIAISEGGSHTKMTLNNRRSVIGRHMTDLKTGTLHAILGQLGLPPEDLEN